MGMGYYQNLSGRWIRVQSDSASHRQIVPPTTKTPSEDTIIRREINYMIRCMEMQNKSSIEIKLILSEKYPNYSEYIIKMINQYFGKPNKTKTSNVEKGDER